MCLRNFWEWKRTSLISILRNTWRIIFQFNLMEALSWVPCINYPLMSHHTPGAWWEPASLYNVYCGRCSWTIAIYQTPISHLVMHARYCFWGWAEAGRTSDSTMHILCDCRIEANVQACQSPCLCNDSGYWYIQNQNMRLCTGIIVYIYQCSM